MAPQRLLKHFDRLAEAPDAVPRLRRFILDLAVRGKLVEQDPNDEPALSRLNEPKADVQSDDEPFEIPRSWMWARVADLAECRLGKMLDKARNKGIPRRYLRNINVRWFDFDLSDVLEMRFEDSELTEFGLRRGDVLICEGGEPGRAAVWDEREADIYFQKAIHRARFSTRVHPHFFVIVLRVSADSGDLATYFTGVGIKHFTGKGLSTFRFPLPPLAEQHRIVARVDELMVLCDTLEAAQAERESRQDWLVAATHVRLADLSTLNSQPPTFFINHLPQFTTRPEHIQQLRHTILNLAVRGELVPQDPQDEPVATLLNRIDEERVVTARGDRRAAQETQELLADGLCWTVPATWRWRGMADLVLFIDYRGKTPAKSASGVRLITAKNVRRGFINLEPGEFVAKATYDAWMTRGLPREGDILFTTEAPMGNAAVVRIREKFGLAQRVINFRLYGGVDPNFMVLQLLSQPFQAILDATATGLTAKGIKAAKLKRLPVAIPPLAEQHRIVAKVNELMTLCDQLEAQLATTAFTGQQLLDATIQQAISGQVELQHGARR